ncbi:MAG: phosphatase PAP2 family protein [Bacteroidetes bacterium]|nr:phosphatase PAP2 family protein [Bacteroidota bacterium]
MTRLAGFAMLLLLASGRMQAQQTDTGSRLDHDVDVFLQDAADIFTSPGSFSGTDWLNVGLVVGTTAAAYLVDEDVRIFSQTHRLDENEDWLFVGDMYGRGIIPGAAAALLYAGGLTFEDEWIRVTGRMLLQSLIYSGMINQFSKFLFGRARPYTGDGKTAFHFFGISSSQKAFPSGHATAAFAFSSTLSRRVGSLPFSLLLYTLSTATVLQRIDTDRHWLSDTVLGAAIGACIGIAVVQIEEGRAQHRSSEVLPISAGLYPHAPLLGITYGF